MIEQQDMQTVELHELTAKAKAMYSKEARLVQIGCTKMDSSLEVNYSFDENYQFTNYRIVIPNADTILPSISPVYFAAAIYENELKDLFGLKFSGLALDYQGEFYKKSIPNPFNPGK
ncbi:MAG: NADH-quinone oxidoreductase subunit C [Pseudomonadota bacterium]